MQSLLRWSIENSGAGGEENAGGPPQPRTDLDPAIIDQILGKPDAELMKEALAVALDESRDEDDRLQALDNFEMLVEHIDNANDLAKLKMWEPLLSFLTSPSTSNEIKTQALWIVGTAVQNNPAAQNACLALSPMQTILSFLTPSAGTSKMRSKAVYALSGLLKHSAAAVRQLRDANGWEALKASLEDSDITVRRKTAFLLNALLIPEVPIQPPQSSQTPQAAAAPQGQGSTAAILHPSAAPPPSETIHPNSHASMLSDPSSVSTSELALDALENRGLLQTLINGLVHPVPHGVDGEKEGDWEFEEKVVSVLQTYLLECHGKLSEEQRQALSSFLQEHTKKAGGDGSLADKWGMTVDEVRRFKKAVE